MKKITFAPVFVLAALFALSCASAPKSATGNRFDGFWTPSGKSIPGGEKAFKPLPLAAGQYVVTGSLAKGKRQSADRTLIVRKDAKGWVIENSTVDPKGKETVSQMCLAGYEEARTTGDATKLKMVWMKSYDDKGQLQTIEGDQLAMYNAFAKSMYEKMVLKASGIAPAGAIEVPAGNFSGTFFLKASAKIMGFNVETETWYSNAVPINCVVKTRTTDGKNETVLLSFGTDGAPKMK